MSDGTISVPLQILCHECYTPLEIGAHRNTYPDVYVKPCPLCAKLAAKAEGVAQPVPEHAKRRAENMWFRDLLKQVQPYLDQVVGPECNCDTCVGGRILAKQIKMALEVGKCQKPS